MPLRLEIKRKLAQRSERVKSVDLHPTEPWILTSLYSGTVCIWDYQSQCSFEDVFMLLKMIEPDRENKPSRPSGLAIHLPFSGLGPIRAGLVG
ncbi:coatomer subunit beta'-2-like protein [Tanacetum coccineum]